MKRLSFLVSLTNNDNDYQQEQAAAAEKAARRLGVDVKIIHANNDALAQSQQLLHYVQDSGVVRPDAIMFEPAGGTAFPQVARAAAAARRRRSVRARASCRLRLAARGTYPKTRPAGLNDAMGRICV